MNAIQPCHGETVLNDHQKAAALTCLEAAKANTMAFPQIVATLMAAGFESYAIDFRRAFATYYLPGGESIELPVHRVDAPIAPSFDKARLEAAIREAQQQSADYTYTGFCEKAAMAGCAAYTVSFSGRRALYVGRTAETHVEHFPDQ